MNNWNQGKSGACEAMGLLSSQSRSVDSHRRHWAGRSVLHPPGLGSLEGGVPPSCSLVSHLGTFDHEIRSRIPSTTATSNFPSMKYSAAAGPWSVCSVSGRGGLLPPQRLPLTLPCTPHPSTLRPGLFLSSLGAFTSALCPIPPNQDCPSSFPQLSNSNPPFPKGFHHPCEIFIRSDLSLLLHHRHASEQQTHTSQTQSGTISSEQDPS